MKRAALFISVFALVVSACGLKVPTTIVAGEQFQQDPSLADGGNLPQQDETIEDVLDPGQLDGPGGVGPGGDGGDGVVGGVGSGLFKKETEGITNDSIRICAHVPITGAAPIPHHEARFGQFYFDYVNEELGGVFGRKVIFSAIDDQYYPAGARKAMEKCKDQGAFIYFGAAGTDQIVSVAKWADENQVPYVHGPTSIRDMGGLKYNVHAGPNYEFQHKLLARYLVNRFGKDKVFATVRVDSPFFEAGTKAFKEELKKLGAVHAIELKVQKDERQFQRIYFELQNTDHGPVDIVNNFSTPNIWITMLRQRPATYDPTWTAVSPVAGFNIVAQALRGAGRAVVFHHFNPACECATYKDEEISTKKHLPWYSDIQEFLRIFKKYSPEKDPPADDFDYASYLSSKAVHRLLLQIGENPTRSKLWNLFDSYKEDPKKTFPGCAADFSRSDQRIGAWAVNVFELQSSDGTWKQAHPSGTCFGR